MILLTGCKEYSITPSDPHTILDKGLIYSITPYNLSTHEHAQIHKLLTDRSLSTTFLLRIKNTNETPTWTKINNSFVVVNNSQVQHTQIKDTYPLLLDILEKNNYKGLSYSELKSINLELERLQERNLTTGNNYAYEEEFNKLQTKIYSIERSQLLQMELQKTEKEVQHILNTYGFKDQLIYPNSEIVSIIVFPAISTNQPQNFILKFTLDNSTPLSIPYKLQTIN